jgi:hypothetical protein
MRHAEVVKPTDIDGCGPRLPARIESRSTSLKQPSVAYKQQLQPIVTQSFFDVARRLCRVGNPDETFGVLDYSAARSGA